MSEKQPDQPFSNELWSEFFCVETVTGRTFDPLQYLLAARRYTPYPERYDSWEDYYASKLSRISSELVIMIKTQANQMDAVGDIDPAIESIFLIASTLPEATPEYYQTPDSKNDCLYSLFWAGTVINRFDVCHRIINEYEYLYSEEPKFYMNFAVNNNQ